MAKDYDFKIDGLRYKINDDGATVSVGSSNTKLAGDVVIPERVNYEGEEYAVTKFDGVNAFYGCKKLTSVIIPDTITKIEDCTFRHCTRLTWVRIGNSVRTIGYLAFDGCKKLKTINIPDSVSLVGECAFSDCCELSSIHIPASVAQIERAAFAGCNALASISVEPGNQTFDSRDNCNAIIETATNTLVVGCKNSVVADTITEIGKEAFLGCETLTHIEIGNSIKRIGESAFYGCSNLISVKIPNSVSEIDDFAFKDCEKLTNLIISDSLSTIGTESFMNCRKLTSIVIPASVTMISGNAFSCCASLSSVMVDEKNKFFDSRDNCNAIIETETNTLITGCKNTIIPSTVEVIDSVAFGGCKGLKSIFIPHSVTEIHKTAFYGCGDLCSMIVDKNNKKYDSRDNCNAIIESETNTLIRGCMATVVPNTVTKIDDCAFEGCANMSSVVIPNSVVSIGRSAFNGCKNLTSIVIPDSVAEIGKCALDNTKWYSNQPEGIVYAGLIAYNCKGIMNDKSIVIKDGCIGITEDAFARCYKTETFVMPHSVKTIGEGAFHGCSKMKKIIISNSVSKLEWRVFEGCTSLECVEIPESVTVIDYRAFADCSNLKAMIFHAPMKGIGWQAFDDCDNLKEIFCKKKNPKSGSLPSYGTTLYIPEGSIEAYKALSLKECKLVELSDEEMECRIAEMKGN